MELLAQQGEQEGGQLLSCPDLLGSPRWGTVSTQLETAQQGASRGQGLGQPTGQNVAVGEVATGGVMVVAKKGDTGQGGVGVRAVGPSEPGEGMEPCTWGAPRKPGAWGCGLEEGEQRESWGRAGRCQVGATEPRAAGGADRWMRGLSPRREAPGQGRLREEVVQASPDPEQVGRVALVTQAGFQWRFRPYGAVAGGLRSGTWARA